MKFNADVGLDGAALQPMGGFPLKFVEMSDRLGRYEKVAAAAAAIASRFPPSSHPRVLDICCGVGHWGSAMAELGYTVTGIDASSEQVEQARRNGTGAMFQVGDMNEPPPGPFDLLLNTYSSFGYGLTQADDQHTLKAWASVLREGGALVLELADFERAQVVFAESDHVVRGDGFSAPKEDLRVDWSQQLLFVDYTLGDWRWGGFTRFYSSAQLDVMLRASGFRQIEASSDFAGRAPKRPEDWLVLTCWK